MKNNDEIVLEELRAFEEHDIFNMDADDDEIDELKTQTWEGEEEEEDGFDPDTAHVLATWAKEVLARSKERERESERSSMKKKANDEQNEKLEIGDREQTRGRRRRWVKKERVSCSGAKGYQKIAT